MQNRATIPWNEQIVCLDSPVQFSGAKEGGLFCLLTIRDGGFVGIFCISMPELAACLLEFEFDIFHVLPQHASKWGNIFCPCADFTNVFVQLPAFAKTSRKGTLYDDCVPAFAKTLRVGTMVLPDGFYFFSNKSLHLQRLLVKGVFAMIVSLHLQRP